MKLAVDKSFCISINNRVDRQNLALKNLKPIENKTDFWLVEKDHENPERGCYNSHRNIALYALKHNLDRILVFEDDVEFIKLPSKNLVKKINHHILKNEGEIFYLGGVLGEIWPTKNWGIVGCRVMCTQSYIFNRKGIEKLAAHAYSGMPIDVFLSLEFDAYMAFPMLTSQVGGDIISGDIAEMRKIDNNLSSSFWKGNKNTAKQYLQLLKSFRKIFGRYLNLVN